MKIMRKLFLRSGDKRQREQIMQSCERVRQRETQCLKAVLETNIHQHDVLTDLIEKMRKVGRWRITR